MEGPVNPSPPPAVPEGYELEKRVKGGAHWFYWIAAMTLINSIAAQIHSKWQFIIGATFTQLIDYLAVETRVAGIKIVLIGINLFVIAIYALVGYFATKKQNWAFITGVVLYGLDTLIMFLLFKVSGESIGSILFSGLFHVWALLGIISGLKANLALAKLQSQPVIYEPQAPAEF